MSSERMWQVSLAQKLVEAGANAKAHNSVGDTSMKLGTRPGPVKAAGSN